MNRQEQEAASSERAWVLLATVEDHPKAQAWLEEADAATVDPDASRRKYKLWYAAAAAVMALVIGTGLVTHRLLSVPRYETRVGEQRDVVLADGSRVTLNTNTVLKVRYTGRRRLIELERGEALFAVEHDNTRPFDVSAGGTITRALGTEFNVDIRPSSITVSVLEGVVKVIDSATDGAATNTQPTVALAALTKGEALEIHSHPERAVRETADVRRIEAWRTRRLEFTDMPLAEALEEFNRYSSMQVRIGTPELTAVRVSGVFRIGDAEGFLFSLREALGVDVHESPEEAVLMRSRS